MVVTLRYTFFDVGKSSSVLPGHFPFLGSIGLQWYLQSLCIWSVIPPGSFWIEPKIIPCLLSLSHGSQLELQDTLLHPLLWYRLYYKPCPFTLFWKHLTNLYILSFRFLRMDGHTVSPKFSDVHLVSSSSHLCWGLFLLWGEVLQNFSTYFISKSNPLYLFYEQ